MHAFDRRHLHLVGTARRRGQPAASGSAFTVACLALAGFCGCSLLEKRDGQTVQTQQADKDRQIAQAKPAPTPRINPMTHLAAGRMLESQGDPRAAIEQYERAIAAAPKLAAGYNRLGVLYQKLGRYADADTIFTRGIETAPESAVLWNNRGYNRLLQKRHADAEEQFLMALSLSPSFKRARMNLGIVYAQVGKLDDSVNQFRAVVAEDAAHYNVAVIRLAAGDRENAERSLRLALAANPNLSIARQQLERIAPGSTPGPVALHQDAPLLMEPAGTADAPRPTQSSPVQPLEGPIAGTAEEEPIDEP